MHFVLISFHVYHTLIIFPRWLIYLVYSHSTRTSRCFHSYVEWRAPWTQLLDRIVTKPSASGDTELGWFIRGKLCELARLIITRQCPYTMLVDFFTCSPVPLCEKDTIEMRLHEEQRHADHASLSLRLALVSLIRIHLRCHLGRVHLPLQSNLRCTLRVCVIDLIIDWGQCGTNKRHALFDERHVWPVSPIWCPHGHLGCQLHPESSQFDSRIVPT
jgi:hypothetical protein